MSLAPIAAVEYLKAALAFPSNHGLGMTIAQLDLSNRRTGCIDLAENYRRAAPRASRRPARALISASSDLDGRRDGIEVGFEHRHQHGSQPHQARFSSRRRVRWASRVA